MGSMNEKPTSKRADRFRRRNWLPGMTACSIAAVLLASAWLSSLAGAQDAAAIPAATGAPTTFVVFADRPMAGDEWAALFEAAERSVTAGQIDGADRTVEFVRGDEVHPGLIVTNPVVVHLHGDCSLEPLPRRTAYSVPLGWVRRENGQIAPFINVDCTRIGQVLGVQAQGLDKQARDRMMAGALARVLQHEWIHVSRQSAEHGRDGITKAAFGVADLLGDAETHIARR